LCSSGGPLRKGINEGHFVQSHIQAYLKRINYNGPTVLAADTLRRLQVAHLQTVPFENLSIHAGAPIVLADEALFTKIVERRRGGFCYELNGLFAAMLRVLGFDVTMLSAEVANPLGGFSEPFDHMTLMVTLEQRWLVDVGFGDCFIEPLLLDESGEQVDGRRTYRIVPDGEFRILEQRDDAGWTPQYRFKLDPYNYNDFAAMCRYHQTSPQSHFTQKRICSRLTTERGRITLSDMHWIETSIEGQRSERTIVSEQEYDRVLEETFGIVLPAPT
jgi:N-hydroxyarylamine O-acetyltransferase